MEPSVPAKPSQADITNPAAPSPMSIEQCIVAWLHEKAGRSESSKTRVAYHDTMEAFRAALLASGSDLNGLLSTVALAAQGWAAVDQELEAGVRSIAVPIRDSSGRVVAAINASAHAARVPMRTLEKQFLPRLLDASRQIDAELATRMAVGARVVR